MECQPTIPIDWAPTPFPKGMYWRLIFGRRSGLQAGQTLPAIHVSGKQIHVRRETLEQYRFVTMVPASDDPFVPLMFPHALLGSAHLIIISHDAFPIPSFGILHLRNHVIQYRSFGIDEPWDVSCHLARQRNVEKGLEFDFDTTVSIGGDVVWRSVSTYLKRMEPAADLEISPLADLFPPLGETIGEATSFGVPHNIGKRYAKVTGDYNPIHVSGIAAKFCGFKRAIAHGMWSLARVIAELPPVTGAVRMDVAFKGPMFVNSQATVKNGPDGRFDLYCGANPRPVIVGVYQEAHEGEVI